MVREWSVNWTKGTTQDTTRTTTGGPRNEEWFVSSFFHFHFLWLISCFRSSLLSSLHYKWAKWKEKEKETNHTSLLGLTVHSCSASFSSFFALFSLPKKTNVMKWWVECVLFSLFFFHSSFLPFASLSSFLWFNSRFHFSFFPFHCN